MAVNYVMNYTAEHNLFVDEENIDVLPSVDTLIVNQYLNLEIFSKEINICLEDILKLNPDIKRNVIPNNAKNFKLLVPSQRMVFLQENLDSVLVAAKTKGTEQLNMTPSKKSSSSSQGKVKVVYTVRSGDAVGKIAQKYHVSSKNIRTWNRLRGNLIHPGQRLTIYKHPSYFKKTTPKKKQVATKKKSAIPNGKVYTVRSGDSLWSISHKYGMTVKRLKALNNLKSNSLRPGQKLKLG
jgi:membrane-bound lytic murein transglycosylase D